jgi:hypothetical protein
MIFFNEFFPCYGRGFDDWLLMRIVRCIKQQLDPATAQKDRA